MWLRVTCVLLLGYLSVGRAFAYLGIPPWKVFVGEIALGSFLLWGPRVGRSSWLRFALRSPCLHGFWMWYGLFFAYGVIQVFYGVHKGHPPLTVIRDLAFNYYPLYFFLGLWAGRMRPNLLPRLIRSFAWFNGIYGVLFIVYLNRLEWFMPGVSAEVAPVAIFGQPVYSFVALLGLLACEKSASRSWYLWLLNGFVMLGMQIRGEWLAFAVGVVIWCLLTRQGWRVVQAGAVLGLLFTLMYVTDFQLASPVSRSEYDISARQLVDRALAPFRADLADQNAAAGVGPVDPREATFVFRTVWWLAIWDSVHSSFKTAVWGHGYGFALGDLVPYLEGQFIRTPHNTFFYALGYTGWIGVVLFTLFQIAIFRLLWDAYGADGKPLGIILWATMLILSLSTAFFEAPYGAVPFYLLVGFACAPLLCVENEMLAVARNPVNRAGLPAPVPRAAG